MNEEDERKAIAIAALCNGNIRVQAECERQVLEALTTVRQETRVAAPEGDAADVLKILAGRHHAEHHKQFPAASCPAWPCDILRAAASSSAPAEPPRDSTGEQECQLLGYSYDKPKEQRWCVTHNQPVVKCAATTPIPSDAAMRAARNVVEELKREYLLAETAPEELNEIAAIITRNFVATPTAANVETVTRFRDLQRNWDSYGASPIDPVAIEVALLLAPVLPDWQPVPRSDGGIQFEKDGNEIVIDTFAAATTSPETPERKREFFDAGFAAADNEEEK